ncbi:helix-turn-helix transcriptional regulator [Myroides profundi]|uniref:Plasmid maintenance system antidote protein VapI, contains XRE-type HTH domain n=1 Tax=Myroides profundi TaxID=480520 RepID=A0AAJ4W4Y2_MYRPR|nr:transcriptional regulator [Myroides profundi]AJH14322.1 plasmid maintenance system antidote protein [Myroides profundi]SER15574.1 Plasmid maintenance system antidote protein VapI, contains XRE-type HTH domain [Myroides profundi]
MKKIYEQYKGIHPGIILDRELKKRSIKQRPLALLLDEHPQTFNAITKGKRAMPIPLALKVERELGIEEGTFSILQVYYDIAKVKETEATKPNISLLTPALFWDTDINKINWTKQYKSVILRIFERGNETDKEEIVRFYGEDKVNEVLRSADNSLQYSPKINRL